MSTTCEKTFTITVLEGDMPLNSAVYEPSRDRIYAVRDNWIFELSATTGAKVAEHRMVPIGIAGDNYITYDSTTDKLWAFVWRDTTDSSTFKYTEKPLLEINPADITDITAHYSSGGPLFFGSLQEWEHGAAQLFAAGGILYCLYCQSAAFRNDIARINLLTLTTTNTGGISGAGGSWNCIHSNGTVLAAGGLLTEHLELKNLANLNNAGTIVGWTGLFPYGITSIGDGTFYWCTRSRYVIKQGPTQIDLGRANANPHNIRYNSNDGLIYIPLYRDDTVAVLNPADDSFVIKTGFTNPWDCVFTPTKKFAVQHSSIGLKEIT